MYYRFQSKILREQARFDQFGSSDLEGYIFYRVNARFLAEIVICNKNIRI